MTAAIRQARLQEAPAVTALVRDAYAHYVPRIGREPMPMIDDYDKRIADGQTWVLEDDGAIIGILVLEDGADDILLDNIAIKPAHQGRGHGRRLIAFTEDRARARGCSSVWLYTNVMMTENIALYTRLGFVETGRDSGSGWHRVFMRKMLG